MLPLSFAQARLWFLARLERASASYNIPLAARLLGRLDAGALEAALDDVVARHESLRTLLKEVDGEPYQAILEPAHVALGHRVCAAAQVDEVLASEASRPFDLGGELPLRAVLLELGRDEHVLVLVVHHAAADGWSMGRLLEDLARAYRAPGCRGGRRTMRALPVQYADYALWQRALLGEEADPEQRDPAGSWRIGAGHWRALP